jgi:hypothetical protein
MRDPEMTEPVLQSLAQYSIRGVDAIEKDRVDLLIDAANAIADGYCAIP